MQSLLVDAGPLIALIDRDDPWHAACRDAVEIQDRLLTVWPAFAEAMYMLGKIGGQDQLFELVDRHAIGFASLGPADFPRMRELMRKYRDLPMDLADAALVRVAEREKISRIFTTDRGDFELYRPHRLGRFRILP
ncbi:MAG: PIN domain-containing protein [Candidatus Binatus sp.]|uniref:type II toxin-antitoxin system VapC family toxin n=1 Tax=Candidatus Binatus sp. TaxID=2811406 RepID=UPI002724FA49|nr:PIN domain-containing protein [Candidatus Binatus sp.]MDO8430815.1 PIN domain-containing protein [Candidatus Binatus sp.]